jgi:hypothetical protein
LIAHCNKQWPTRLTIACLRLINEDGEIANRLSLGGLSEHSRKSWSSSGHAVTAGRLTIRFAPPYKPNRGRN